MLSSTLVTMCTVSGVGGNVAIVGDGVGRRMSRLMHCRGRMIAAKGPTLKAAA
jgi:hypothetical protein